MAKQSPFADVVFDTETTACGLASFEAGVPVTCDETPIGTLVMACVHEHVEKLPVCVGCGAEVQRGAGEWGCSACAENDKEPHPCLPLVVIEWDSGEKTVVQEGAVRAC